MRISHWKRVRGPVRIDDDYRKKLFEDLRSFLEIERNLSKATADRHLWYLRDILDFTKKPLEDLDVNDFRDFLRMAKSKYASSTYRNWVKTVRVVTGYLGKPEVGKRFKIPSEVFKPKYLPSLEELRAFYEAIDHPVVKLLFMVWCTSGLRFSEVFDMSRDQLDLKNRMLVPDIHEAGSKQSWVSFVNAETAEMLKEYLMKRDDDSPRLFRISPHSFRDSWNKATKTTGLRITPRTLRFWFANKMSDLSLPDRYIDCLQGRTPKSILSRFYTDFNPRRLRELYLKVDLQILQ